MKETNTTTNAAFTDEEIDEIMNDPTKKQLAMLYINIPMLSERHYLSL